MFNNYNTKSMENLNEDRVVRYLRLTQAVEYLRGFGLARTHEDIATLMGVPRSNVSAALNGNTKYLTEGYLNKFADAYSDKINKTWLLYGGGEMAVPDKNLRPHFSALARAGFMGDHNEGETGRMTAINEFMPEYDFTIVAQGNSMAPKIEDGDILFCRAVADRNNMPIGRICVVDSIDGALVKEIAEVTENDVLLHSLNPEFDDIRIKNEAVSSIAEVRGILRNL